MINTDEKLLCCGCQTCKEVCPQDCISFFADEIGALYPRVDQTNCIGCGQCENVCPLQKKLSTHEIGREAFAAYAKDSSVRFSGASGGMFELIANEVVNEGGSVFACCFNSELKLRCVEATTYEEARGLTKSKYLQSESADMFPTIFQRIKDGRKVLFCSTPCQVAALKNYLGKMADKNNVWFVDFFCHGVPSQELFDKCLAYIEKNREIKVKNYEFRSKKPNGATPHYYTMTYEKNGKEHREMRLYLDDPFYLGFQKYITLRDSCYHCPYGAGDHAGDLTIGDFHNIDKYLNGINRFDGVSTVLVNTERGQTIWGRIESQCKTWKVDINQLYQDGQIYAGGTKEPKSRAEFVQDMELLPFETVVDKWFNSKKEWKKRLYYSMPAFIRKPLKRIAGV